jgi:hypothetical protein
MDRTARPRRRPRRQRFIRLAARRGRANLAWLMTTGWLLAGLWLLPVVAGARPAGADEISRDPDPQGMVQAHPEWPPEVRGAIMAGIICGGMPPEMVRAAWGRPTRMSGGGQPGQRETWHYEGRLRAMERLGGQGMDETGAGEWTVSFFDGRVAGWTD